MSRKKREYIENEDLFNRSPEENQIAIDEKAYIILMKKENNKEENKDGSKVESEKYILGGFKDGKIMNTYYLRVNGEEFKEVNKYYELVLINGKNTLELSVDGENVMSSIEIQYKDK